MTSERVTSCGAGRTTTVVMQNTIAAMDELMLIDDHAVNIAQKSVDRHDWD